IVSRAASDSDVAEEEQHKSGPPCGLDRNVRAPDPAETCRAAPPEMVPVLSLPRALEKTGPGTLCVLSDNENGRTYGRALTVADRLGEDRVILANWIRRLTNRNGRQAPLAVWKEKIAPVVAQKLAEQKTPIVSF